VPDVVLFPTSTEQVVDVVKLCHRHGIHFVPRGAGTSLAGGTLTVGGQGVTVLESSPGRMLLDVQPTTGPHNGIQIRETAVDPGSPIKNIRVLLPGYTAVPKDNPFNPAFLEVLRPFKVLRFIGWDYANRSDVTTWSDERPVTYATQSSPVNGALITTTGFRSTGVAGISTENASG